MKTLLCALAMLVTGYSAVEAAEYTYERCDETGQVVVCEKIQPEYLLIPFGYLDSCRSILQEAMRQMDEFVGGDPSIVQSVYVTPADRLRKEADRIERHDKALAMWDQAKARCWTKK